MRLDPDRKSFLHLERLRLFQENIVAQQAAATAVVDRLQIIDSGLLHGVKKPLGVFLFLGPTGTGKTRVAEFTSTVLHGTQSMIVVDCAEFQHSHEIARLVGSPPGYLGHRETHPFLSQERLSSVTSERSRVSIILFDEIEKASDSLWNILLGIFDKARLTLGDNRTVDFSQTLIFLTSNLGSREIFNLAQDKSFGFHGSNRSLSEKTRKIEKAGITAARRRFTPEFMNRLDEVITFKTFTAEEYRRILHIELRRFQDRVFNGEVKFVFTPTEGVIDFLLERSAASPEYGARPIQRTLNNILIQPLSGLIDTGQIVYGDWIKIDYNNKLLFHTEGRNLSVTAMYKTAGMPPPDDECSRAAAAGGGGGVVSGGFVVRGRKNLNQGGN